MTHHQAPAETTNTRIEPIQFFYFADCPSHDIALQRLRDVLSEECLQADIEIIQVKTEEQAQQLRFVGSPTILINGQDIARVDANAPYALTCRAYHMEDGRISPLPSAEMIRAALRRAAGERQAEQER
jgi:hypothetical protein